MGRTLTIVVILFFFTHSLPRRKSHEHEKVTTEKKRGEAVKCLHGIQAP